MFAGYQAKCIFIDLGAADGNTFAKFIENLGLVCQIEKEWDDDDDDDDDDILLTLLLKFARPVFVDTAVPS